jgi:hypothetical protein
LILVRIGLEVGGLVGGLLARDDLDAGGLQRLLDLVREAFAIGGGVVVHERDLLAPSCCRRGTAAMAGPCWSSRPTTRNTFLKPCSVSLGLVAEPEIIGMPAWL